MANEHQHRHQHHHPRDHHPRDGAGKPGLRTWWQHITTTQKPRPPSAHAHAQAQAQAQMGLVQEYVPPPPGAVFGRPLKETLKFAHVQISTADATGKLYVWGYIPVVVAKWCVVLVLASPSPPFLSPLRFHHLPLEDRNVLMGRCGLI